VGGGDRFGNTFVLRLPDSIDEEVPAMDSEQLRSAGERDASRADNFLLAHFFMGEAVTGISMCKFSPDTSSIMLAATLSGAVAAFVPFAKADDIQFFQSLEAAIRLVQEQNGALARATEGDRPPPLAELGGSSICYRNHHSYRSFYEPCKSTIDGDLCESFGRMPSQVQQQVAAAMGVSVGEVKKRVGVVRRSAVGF